MLAQDGEPGTCLIVNDCHQVEANHEVVDHAPSGGLPAFDEILQLWNSTGFEQPVQSGVSRFRRAMMPIMLSAIALVVAFALGGYRVLTRPASAPRSVQRLAPTGSHNAAVSGKQRGTPVGNEHTNLTDSARERSQEQKPPVESALDLVQAARSGDPNAQFELGTAYVRGRGVTADPVNGYTWLILASANGNKQAESLMRELTRTLNASDIARIRWNLGQMYADGIGVRPDKVTAYMWHLLAEFSGETRSRIAISRLSRSMTADQKSEAETRASEWLRKHRQGSKNASTHLIEFF
jgi:hypothetical protein